MRCFQPAPPQRRAMRRVRRVLTRQIKMNIRKGTVDDFEQVFALLPQLWPNAKLNKKKIRLVFSRSVNSEHQQYLCAIERKVIVGFCSLSIRNSLWQQGFIAHIDEIIVDQAHRGQGIGTQLMTKALKIAAKTGCARVELDSAFYRKQTHVFYDQLGFENRAYLFSKLLNKR
jgi:glucosamine-phosphate N-acetyltransferase